MNHKIALAFTFSLDISVTIKPLFNLGSSGLINRKLKLKKIKDAFGKRTEKKTKYRIEKEKKITGKTVKHIFKLIG